MSLAETILCGTAASSLRVPWAISLLARARASTCAFSLHLTSLLSVCLKTAITRSNSFPFALCLSSSSWVSSFCLCKERSLSWRTLLFSASSSSQFWSLRICFCSVSSPSLHRKAEANRFRSSLCLLSSCSLPVSLL